MVVWEMSGRWEDTWEPWQKPAQTLRDRAWVTLPGSQGQTGELGIVRTLKPSCLLDVSLYKPIFHVLNNY